MKPDAYTLVVASHKGGTGRTTTACALAWWFGQLGHSVVLADADPVGSVRLLAVGEDGGCEWPNVRYLDRLPRPGEARGADVVVVDGPALLGSGAGAVLARADGLVLTCLADPLSLRTIPAAGRAVEDAKAANPKLDLLGLLITAFDPADPLQGSMLARLRQTHAGLLIEPPVPLRAELREWPSAPGTPPPPGAAADALGEVARTLESWIGLGAAV
jgi:cellulose biosynthesis protein BcsQ